MTVSEEKPQLWYIYDCGFRWGKPDLVYDPGCAYPVNHIGLSEARRMMRNGGCDIPGCYICKQPHNWSPGRLF